MDLAKLGKFQRQIAVAARPAVEHRYRARTVHGLDCKFNVVDGCEEHVLLVMVPVARCLPERLVHYQRRIDFQIAALCVLCAPERHELVPDYHAFGVEERHARGHVMEAVKVQLLAKQAMIVLAKLLCLSGLRWLRSALLLRCAWRGSFCSDFP